MLPSSAGCRTHCVASVAELELAVSPGGVLAGWELLAANDPVSTLFQAPFWCLPWYRHYTDFEPRVLALTENGDLVGVIPLAIETSTGRLTFAGDVMTDYRDVVARPERRAAVLNELLRFIRSGGFRNVLLVGPSLPESETPQLLLRLCPENGAHAVYRSNHGWRWWPEQATEDPEYKMRYAIRCLKRQGELTFSVIQADEEWNALRDEFYDQNSLRQIFGGRAVTFHRECKRRFFDDVMRGPAGHAIALRVNGELVAGHAGFVHRDVLYWSAPSFDIRQRRNSPGVVLMALALKNLKGWGLRGLDLTMGEGDLKERFSTERVDLHGVEIHPRASTYYSRAIRLRATGFLRGIAGEDAWEHKLKPRLRAAVSALRRMRGAGIRGALRAAKIVAPAPPIEYAARAGDLREPVAANVTLRHNRISDLLRCDVGAHSEALSAAARACADMNAAACFHSMLVDDRLAGWVFTAVRDGAAHVENAWLLPEFRGRGLGAALLAGAARYALACGGWARMSISADNLAARRAAETAGFSQAASLSSNDDRAIADGDRGAHAGDGAGETARLQPGVRGRRQGDH